jgi:hypothetical protein
LVVAAGVFLLYRAGRGLSHGDADQALANTSLVLDIERALGIATERSVQSWTLGSQSVVDLLNHYYVMVHFPATVAFLVWVFVRHQGAYRSVRRWFVAVTLTALVVHVAFPLAPPRMLPGFVDTLSEYGPRIYSADPQQSVANQFAAMPSLHFGWALMVAVSIIAILRTRRSLLALAHPAITLFAIVATGNHYWLDAIAVTAIAAPLGLLVVAVQRRAVETPPPGVPAAGPRSRCALAAHRTAVTTAGAAPAHDADRTPCRAHQRSDATSHGCAPGAAILPPMSQQATRRPDCRQAPSRLPPTPS